MRMPHNSSLLPTCLFLVSLTVTANYSNQASTNPANKPQVAPEQIGAVRSFQLLSPGAAWILAGRQILWTANGGNLWEDITPPISASDAIDNVVFLDETMDGCS